MPARPSPSAPRKSGSPSAAAGCARCPPIPNARRRAATRASASRAKGTGWAALRPRRFLLDQSLGLEGFLHLRALAYAFLVIRNRRPAAHVELHHRRPVEDREQVGIRDAEFVAHQVLLP